jgi:DNA modification methylase
MGKDWDRLDGEAWRTGGGFTKPGIGDRPTPWASYGSGDTANATCGMCGGRMRGARRCECETPDWRVKGKPLRESDADSKRGQAQKMQEWHEAWAREALRVLKPGGHLLAFGGTRTYHRLACAVEDAGFEIRDCLAWLYGSGFPKSLDVSKSIDKAAGAEREVVGVSPHSANRAVTSWHAAETAHDRGRMGTVAEGDRSLTAPATPEAERWQGWGTALKPAHEPIVLARKPLSGTVAGNVLAHGTGALNVDGCRIGTDEDRARPPRTANAIYGGGNGTNLTESESHPAGRWPANVCLDPEAAALLDEQTGTSTSRIGKPREGANGDGWGMTATGAEYGDSGGASRFLYVAKASSAERNAGLDGFEETQVRRLSGGDFAHNSGSTASDKAGATVRNVHPTVKPIELMRWLVRLVTPPNGLVLDPFTGSGTTGCAAVLEGFRFVGIEREPEYAAIARARIAWWSEHPDGMKLVERLEHERAQKALADAGQIGLF